jgi:hypothetical protein
MPLLAVYGELFHMKGGYAITGPDQVEQAAPPNEGRNAATSSVRFVASMLYELMN